MEFLDTVWNELSSNIVFYISLIPLGVGLWKWKALSRFLRIFYGYLLLDLLIAFVFKLFIWSARTFPETIVPVLELYQIENTNFLGILYHINVVGMLSWYFHKVIPNAIISTLIRWFSSGLVLAILINYLFIEGYREMGLFNPTMASFCGFIFPLLHLWYLFRQDYQLVLTRNPYFWIALGLVFAMLLGFFKALVGGLIFGMDYPLFTLINIPNNILIAFSYLIYSVGFLFSHNTAYLAEPPNSTILK